MCRAIPTRLSLFLLSLLLCGPALADKHVAAVGKATPSYLERRMVDGQLRRETYVFMAGERHDGAIRDGSFEHTTFREIAEYLAPKLTQQNYWPTPDVKDADLLIAVHWGVTRPRETYNDMTTRTTLSSDPAGTPGLFVDSQAKQDIEAALGGPLDYGSLAERMSRLDDVVDGDQQVFIGAGTARLLGYTETLRKLSQEPNFTTQQYTLEHDLRSERYFIIVRAYDLHAATKEARSRPVWTLHLNTSSPGNNFKTALASMSEAGASLFGHNTDGVTTVLPKIPKGHVELHDLIIVGEAK
jgi:hypothetical protein